MRSLARWCFTHRFRVLAAWVLALVVLGGLSVKAGSGYTDSFSLPGTESTTALNLLTDNFNTESTDTNQVVFAAEDVNDPATKARIERTLDQIAKLPHVERVDSPFAEGAAQSQISKNGEVAFATVHMDGEQPIADVPKSAYDKLIATAETARRRPPGGAGRQCDRATESSGGGPPRPSASSRPLVLALAFGSLAASALPLVSAVVSSVRRSPDRAPRARDDRRRLRPHARHPDRPRRRHRLRAVHRHPAPTRSRPAGPRGRASTRSPPLDAPSSSRVRP